MKKSKIILAMVVLMIALNIAACGGAERKAMQAREKERKEQDARDRLDRDKKDFNSNMPK